MLLDRERGDDSALGGADQVHLVRRAVLRGVDVHEVETSSLPCRMASPVLL